MKEQIRKSIGDKNYRRLQEIYTSIRGGFFSFRRLIFEIFGSARYSKVALGGLDDKLAPYLNFREGVFIEAGANDGVSQSNTYYLEKTLGWSGVLVEPVPRLFNKCRKNRRRSRVFNCALVSPESAGTGVMICDKGDRGLLSCVATGEGATEGAPSEVVGRTLTSVLEAAGLSRVDFFSLDVEGYELEVFKGLALARFAPRHILVETARVEKVDDVLCPAYERIAQLTFHDYLYRISNNV